MKQRAKAVLCKRVCQACKCNKAHVISPMNKSGFTHKDWLKSDEEWWHEYTVFCRGTGNQEDTRKSPPAACDFYLEHIVIGQDETQK